MTAMTPTALSINEALRRLSIGRTRLYELIGSGQISARKIGRRTIILDTEIARFLAACPETPGGRGSPPGVGPIQADSTTPTARTKQAH
jgi:excisionase family DNA binding protein